MKRRKFIANTTAFSIGASLISIPKSYANMSQTVKRKFRICLNPGTIAVKADQRRLMDLAYRHGFEAMIPMPGDLAKMDSSALKSFLEEMKEKNLSWGSAGLPVQFRASEQEFRKGLNELPKAAKAMEKAGATRMGTWIMPTHKDLTYLENFHQHKARLKAMANILGHHGISLGLEYVGPKTLMSRDKFAFIRTMKEAKALIHAIGEDNVGLVLDSFHWYCAGDSKADLLTLDNSDIVTVDLNDARKGFSAAEQIDGKRELPAATGVIDIKSFLEALVQIGYDGPVRAEPFNQPVRDMEDEEAVKATFAAMKKAVDMV